MQEIVILLTGVAGAASAAAYRRLPRGRLHGAGRPKGGAGSGTAGRMRSRLGALAAERDILGKAISRVHGDAGLGGRRRDALLAMYQRQLSAVLAKIDRLEEASRYPDLGPVGDALSEMMDQKLSSLDERLHELSARIAAAVPAAGAGAGAGGAEAATGAAAQGPAAGKRGGKRAAAAAEAAAQKQAALDSAQRRAAEAEAAVPQQEQRRAHVQARAQPQPKRRREEAGREGPLGAAAAEAEAAPTEGRHAVKPVEITTLTTIGGGRKTFPEVGRPRDAAAAAAGARPSAPEAQGQAKKGPGAAAAAAATAAAASAAAAPRPGPQGAAPPSLPASLPKPRPSGIPDAELEDADAGANAAGGRAADDDLAAIVADIRSTLSKLEQAEVE